MQRKTMYVGGIDIGSVAAKFVIMDDQHKVLSYVVTDTIPDVQGLASSLRQQALEQANLSEDQLARVFSTGYGRDLVWFAHDNRSEIICHAAGTHGYFPSARTIVDIGGQDSKVIRVDSKGKVVNFVMNTRCAAGTGRFTEVMAKALQVDLDQWGASVAAANHRVKISNICTVFAESEVISKIMLKVPVNDILAGVCESIVARVYESVQRAGGARPDIAFTGGVANNQGVRLMLEEKLGVTLLVPEVPQSTGAFGAARLALQSLKNSKIGAAGEQQPAE